MFLNDKHLILICSDLNLTPDIGPAVCSTFVWNVLHDFNFQALTHERLEVKFTNFGRVDHLWPHKQVTVFIFKVVAKIFLQSLVW